MTRALWTLAVLLSHWRRHPMQLATLLIGLISATALWSGVQALNQQARISYDRAAAMLGGARTAMLVAKDGGAFPQSLFVDLRRAGWPVSPVVEGRIQIGGRSFRLLGIEPMTLPGEVGNAPAVARGEFQAFITPPGQMLAAPETLSDLKLAAGARPASNNGALLPPLRVQQSLVPDVLVVDIGIAQQVLNMPGQMSRLLLGKAKGQRASLESVAGDRLRLVEPEAATDLERLTDSFHLNLTAFGLLSFFVGLFIVNSAVGLAFEQRLPMLRTRELRLGDSYLCRGIAARRRSLAARALWRVDPGTSHIEAGMVARRIRHFRARRARGFRRQPDQGGAAAGARRRAAAGLAAGAAALAETAGCGGDFRVRDCRGPVVAWRLAGFRICRARGADARRRACPAGDSRTRAGARRARRGKTAGALVLGR